MSQEWTKDAVLARPFDAAELINQYAEEAHANRKTIRELFNRIELLEQEKQRCNCYKADRINHLPDCPAIKVGA